jgi:RNA polymerase sigma factor (sigma-70 family)
MADRKTTKPVARSTVKRAVTQFYDLRRRIMDLVRRKGGSQHDQEDVAQSVMMKMQYRSKPGDIVELGGYVHIAVTNALTDLFNERRSDRSGRDGLESLYQRSAASSAEEICMHQDLLNKAMNRLSKQQREAVTLVTHLGLTHEEAARKMNITPRRLRTVLTKALQCCQEFLETTGEST